MGRRREIITQDLQYLYEDCPKLWEKLRNSTVLVTGAYGMLASYMVYMLIYLNEEKDYQIRIIAQGRDRDKMEKRFAPYCARAYFDMMISDVKDQFLFKGEVDYVIHGASPASSQYYDSDPVGVLMPNVLGTYNTLEFSREKRVKGYLFFSSGEIYGNVEKEMSSESDGGYLDTTNVRSCYGEGKRVGEVMCKCWQHQYKVPARIVRPSHTYGPTMDIENDQRVFSEFVRNIVRGEDIVIRGDGSATRIFCYIADAVKAYFLVLLSGEDGEAYNVSDESGLISIGELAEMLCKLFPEKQLKVKFGTHAEGYVENPHKCHSNYSTKKLQDLGWSGKFGIREGFKRTIESFG